MKRIKWFLILWACLLPFMAQAGRVTEQQALQRAQQFMRQQGGQVAALQGKSFTRVSRHQAPGMVTDTPYYVFNAEQRGYVIASADDRTVPVLAYSLTGTLDLDNLPENIQSWLDGYADQLEWLNEHPEAAPAAKVFSAPAIAPLIQTQWNQGSPYNLMTPTYETVDADNNPITVHYVTGCVATALAQVMYYYNWPKDCPALPEYTTGSLSISVPALSATTFKWDKMKLKYSSSETGEAADAVAELMRYVGQAIKMNYTPDGSGSNVQPKVMIETFKYSKNMNNVSRSNYTTDEWEALIYEELKGSRPVLYDGASESGGHQFICDGYDGNGFFHINWGWGGNQDGYFVISVCDPDEKGIGGGTGTGGYIYGQSAFLGFVPATDGEPEIPIFGANTKSLTAATYTRTSATENFVDVSTDKCYFYGYYNYKPTTTFPIEAGWAVWKNGEILSVPATTEVTIDNRELNVGWYYHSYGPDKVSFGAGLPDGQYRLVQVWRPQSSSDAWTVISTKNAIYAEIAGNSLSVRGDNSGTVTYTIDDVAFSGEMAKGTENLATVTFTNTCDATQEYVYFWIKEGGSWKLKGRNLASVDPGQTGQVTISFTPNTAGTLDCRISTDESGNNVVWNSTVTIHDTQQVTVNGIVYRLNLGTNEATVVGSSSDEELTVQPTVTYGSNTYTVTRIASKAFGYDVTSVSLPTTLRIIEKKAFYNCGSLKEIAIPEGVESIGSEAFAYSWNLAKVSLPSTLTSLGSSAFYGDSRLANVTVAMASPLSITADVFSYSSGEEEFFTNAVLYVPVGTKATYQQADVWKLFTTIYEGELKQTTIDGITYSYVENESFADIVAADAGVLSENALVIPGSITVGGKSYKLRKIEDRVFMQVQITSLTIEPGLEEIGNYCFWNCYYISKLVIPESVKTIGANAFRYCFGMTELSLPSTLTAIGDYAFGNCTYLNKVYSTNINPCIINDNVFQIVNTDKTTSPSTATLHVPGGTKDKYQSAGGWNQFAGIVDDIVGTMVLDELATTAPDASGTAVNVTVNRTINAGEWSTICLPFDMSETQVKAVFGNDVLLKELKSWSFTGDPTAATSISLGFSNATSIQKNCPYLIKVATALTSFSVDGVTIDPVATPATAAVAYTVGSDTYNAYMHGYYTQSTVPQYGMFMAGGSKLYYSIGKTKIMGFRASLSFEGVKLASYGTTAPARVTITFDDETTGIGEVMEQTVDDAIYNLRGQRVTNPGKGVYIKNGKKVYIK